ncbi:MAG: ABC transporter permease [Hyphomicrobiales bacterium]|nr:ABC transporter permease [Hyphomicrobiales bacterium]
MDLAFMAESFVRLLGGIPLTLRLAFSAVTLGFLLAALLVVLMRQPIAPLAWISHAFVFVFRGTPLLVQVFLIYYGLGQFRPVLQEWGIWWLFRDPYYCALIALTLNTAAYSAEIVRGGLQSVPAGAVEAARAFGMSGVTLYRRIIGPMALRQALPAYTSEVILMVKATSLASTITLMEITGLAQKLISESFRAVEVFLCAGAIYLAINFTLTTLFGLIERWATPDLAIARAEDGRPG